MPSPFLDRPGSVPELAWTYFTEKCTWRQGGIERRGRPQVGAQRYFIACGYIVTAIGDAFQQFPSGAAEGAPVGVTTRSTTMPCRTFRLTPWRRRAFVRTARRTFQPNAVPRVQHEVGGQAAFQVSLWAPSTLSVSLALSHAVLPKTAWLADRELHNLDWPSAGLPRVVHVDNAKEFHSDALVRGCQEYGVQLDHRPPGQPHFGGHIERLIGTMMGAVHLLPGTTFSDVNEKGSYAAEGRALLTVAELERWLTLQIAGVYHLSVHSALGMTPLAAWQSGITKRKLPIRHPPDQNEFFLDFLPAVSRRIQRDGIHFHSIRYWDSVLN
jgi:transposase InsO family protein